MAMAVNVFKYCTGLRAIGYVMILVVLGIVGLSYYAVVIACYGPQILLGGLKALGAVVVLLIFHVLLSMLLWCYFACAFTDPGSVPPNWQPVVSEDELESQGHNHSQSIRETDHSLLLTTEATSSDGAGSREAEEDARGEIERSGRRSPRSVVGINGHESRIGSRNQEILFSGRSSAPEIRRCKKCLKYKPPRTHHCSVCGRCILKMDHHCVWVVNCVGAKNYKSFLLFLVYTFLNTTIVWVSLLPAFIAFFTMDPEDDGTDPGKLAAVFLTFVLDLAFSLSLLGFLGMHFSLVCANTTTIEAFEKKASYRWRFDMGKKRNFEQVFGSDVRYWFLPMYSPEDIQNMPVLQGLSFPTRPTQDEDGY